MRFYDLTCKQKIQEGSGTMMSWTLLKGFLIKEFKQALRDPRMKMILFVAPMIQLIIFGVAISTDVKNVRLYARPSPNDFILHHIYEHSIASMWFLPAKDTPHTNPFDLLRAGKIDAALIPPPGGLTYALGRNTAPLQLLIDATNVIQAQAVESYLKTITAEVIEQDLKLPKEQSPLVFSVRVLYNPTLETSYFMIPGVMCILVSIITILLTSTSITREKEMGTFEMLISAPITASDIILGKTLPFVIIGICNVPLILTIALFLFNVPMRGSFWVLMLASFAYVCSTVAIGTLISTFAKNQQQSILGGFLFLFPAILLSGLMFPLENMPTIMRWAAYFNPLSHFLALLRNIMLKGGETEFIEQRVIVLIMMAVVFVYISYKRIHTTLQ